MRTSSRMPRQVFLSAETFAAAFVGASIRWLVGFDVLLLP